MKLSYCRIFVLLFSIVLSQKTNAQEQAIELINPSFEDFPRTGMTPRGWFDCGIVRFPKESPPDVHPITNGPFGITQMPIDGLSYLGMVVRSNGSSESVSQRLGAKLKKDKCYTISIDLCRSEFYKSRVRGSDKKVDFTTPIKLRIWGGSGYCMKEQLLVESDKVRNTKWEKYMFYFVADDDYSFIQLEAFAEDLISDKVNGNILLDNVSSIDIISCDDENMKLKGVRYEIPQEHLEYERQKWLGVKGRQRLANAKSKKAFEESKEIFEEIETTGLLIKFKKNKLTSEGQLNLKSIAQHMEDIAEFKLIIDFNGIGTKRYKKRSESIVELLATTNLSSKDYEIRNSIVEDTDVEWLVKKYSFNLGILYQP